MVVRPTYWMLQFLHWMRYIMLLLAQVMWPIVLNLRPFVELVIVEVVVKSLCKRHLLCLLSQG